MKAKYDADPAPAKARAGARYAAKKDAIIAANRAYRANNKEKRRKIERAYYEANKDLICAKKKAYRETNRARVFSSKRAYYLTNKRVLALKTKVWMKANPDKVAASRARRKHLERTAAGGTFSQHRADYQPRVAAYQGLCAYCRKGAYHSLEHVVPLSRGGTNYPNNIVPACKPCNSSKGSKILGTEWVPPFLRSVVLFDSVVDFTFLV